jgi:hypothetical protein
MQEVNWREVDESRYDAMLGVMPPREMTALGYLVGEPTCHDRCTVCGEVLPRWAAFAQVEHRYFEATEPLTVPEFERLTSADVLASSVLSFQPEIWQNNGGRIEGRNAGTSEAEVIAIVGEINNQTEEDTRRARLISAAPEVADALMEFAVQRVWADCRLPGDMREELASFYHTVICPALRKAGRLP